MVHDVFISYSSKDKSIADAITATLESRKVRCWVAPRDVQPGTNFAESITAAINVSKIMVLIFSSNANHSQHVLRELTLAVNKGIVIIPFRIEEVQPSQNLEYFISAVHWLDALTPPIERHLEELAETIQLLLTLRDDIARESQSTAENLESTSRVIELQKLQNKTKEKLLEAKQKLRKRKLSKKLLIYAGIIFVLATGILSSYYAFFLKPFSTQSTMKEKHIPTSKETQQNPNSLPFTIGYYNARSIWTAIGGINIFCAAKKRSYCQSYLGLLNTGSKDWDCQPFLDNIEKLSRKTNWPSDKFLRDIDSLVSKESQIRNISKIMNNYSKNEESAKQFELLVDEIDKYAEALLLEAKRTGLSDRELAMVFVGNQIGKIEQMMAHGGHSLEYDKVLPSCKDFLQALFIGIARFHLGDILNPVLSEFPGLESRINSVGPVELNNVVNRFKRSFLYDVN